MARFEVESAVSCTGVAGSYELWMQYLRSRRTAKLVQLELPERNRTTEARFAALQADNSHYPELLEFAKTLPEFSTLSIKFDMPAIMSGVRKCNRARHADGIRTDSGTERTEAVFRTVWSRHSAQMMTVYPLTIELDQDGIGRANSVNPHLVNPAPLVSAPTTYDEYRRLLTSPVAHAIEAIPSDRGDNGIYALLHPALTEGYIEHQYQVQNR